MAPLYPLPWPVRSDGLLMAPVQIALSLASTSKSGGQSQSGIEQVVASPAARWECKLTLPPLRSAGDIITYRGWLAAMQGRVGTVLMPAFETGRQPWPIDDQGRALRPGRARNAGLIGTAYAVDPVKDAQSNILVTAAAAALNATQLVITATQAGPILAGHRFSLGQRLHEIMTCDALGQGVYSISVRPWLRAAIAPSSVCEFRAPVCLMRFKTDAEGALDLDLNRVANPTINLVEAF